uniref:Uncharacterized protein n=1 Tax=Cyanothece sp. (strain PCC 7425 / ATCC 29141) TaxID=395961 RepID=B8HTY0_CYAP4
MDLQNLLPQQANPIHRTTTGQLPAELAELSDETLCNSGVLPSGFEAPVLYKDQCSYEGDDAE